MAYRQLWRGLHTRRLARHIPWWLCGYSFDGSWCLGFWDVEECIVGMKDPLCNDCALLDCPGPVLGEFTSDSVDILFVGV